MRNLCCVVGDDGDSQHASAIEQTATFWFAELLCVFGYGRYQTYFWLTWLKAGIACTVRCTRIDGFFPFLASSAQVLQKFAMATDVTQLVWNWAGSRHISTTITLQVHVDEHVEQICIEDVKKRHDISFKSRTQQLTNHWPPCSCFLRWSFQTCLPAGGHFVLPKSIIVQRNQCLSRSVEGVMPWFHELTFVVRGQWFLLSALSTLFDILSEVSEFSRNLQ